MKEEEFRVSHGFVSNDVAKMLQEKGCNFFRSVISLALAAKWLREQYGLFVDVYRGEGLYMFDVIDIYGNYNKNHRIDYEIATCIDDYETYEEALNEGIKQTLKNI